MYLCQRHFLIQVNLPLLLFLSYQSRLTFIDYLVNLTMKMMMTMMMVMQVMINHSPHLKFLSFLTLYPVNEYQDYHGKNLHGLVDFVSSDRSSCTDDGLLYIRGSGSANFFRFLAFLPFYIVRSVTLDC